MHIANNVARFAFSEVHIYETLLLTEAVVRAEDDLPHNPPRERLPRLEPLDHLGQEGRRDRVGFTVFAFWKLGSRIPRVKRAAVCVDKERCASREFK